MAAYPKGIRSNPCRVLHPFPLQKESRMSASADQSAHPVGIECPVCGHRFRVPINSLSLGGTISCQACNRDILITTRVIRQLLRQIDSDLSAPQDLPFLLRPSISHSNANHGVAGETPSHFEEKRSS